MSDRIALWFLRRFKLFRDIERRHSSVLSRAISAEKRLENLGASAARKEVFDKFSRERVEAELYHEALLHLPCQVAVDLLPTKVSSEHSRGVVAIQIIVGNRP